MVGHSTMTVKVLAPVVQGVDIIIHLINLYLVDSAIGFVNVYPLDSEFSVGQRIFCWTALSAL